MHLKSRTSSSSQRSAAPRSRGPLQHGRCGSFIGVMNIVRCSEGSPVRSELASRSFWRVIYEICTVPLGCDRCESKLYHFQLNLGMATQRVHLPRRWKTFHTDYIKTNLLPIYIHVFFCVFLSKSGSLTSFSGNSSSLGASPTHLCTVRPTPPTKPSCFRQLLE